MYVYIVTEMQSGVIDIVIAVVDVIDSVSYSVVIHAIVCVCVTVMWQFVLL